MSPQTAATVASEHRAAFARARLVVEFRPPLARVSVLDPQTGLLDRALEVTHDAAAALLPAIQRLLQRAPTPPAALLLLRDPGADPEVLAATMAALAGMHLLDGQACAVWGEGMHGAGGGQADQLHLGFGAATSGLVRGGRPFVGARGHGCAPGHVCVDPLGPPCACGARGCLVALVDLPGLALAGQERGLGGEHPPRPGRDVGVLRDLMLRTSQGCPAARAVLERAAAAFGVAVGGLLNAVDLVDVVVHTPVPEVWPLIQPAVERSLAKHSFAAVRAGLRWHVATLGEEAAVIGAATWPLSGTIQGSAGQGSAGVLAIGT